MKREAIQGQVGRNEASSHRVAIQGELGSNSHLAAMTMCSADSRVLHVVPCGLSAEVVERLASEDVDSAVLPIENSLHGSVSEHYDLLLEHNVKIVAESLLRVRHNVIVAPGVRLEDVRRVMSHPVALSQCRRWLRAHPEIDAIPFYDTAGSIKEIMARGLKDTAGIAPELAAREFGAEVLVAGIEDHRENYTRFYRLERAEGSFVQHDSANKMSIAFSVSHEPGTLMKALEGFRRTGMNLTRIESRPVPGRPWEYVFYVDVRFGGFEQVDAVLSELRNSCEMVKELGRYAAA